MILTVDTIQRTHFVKTIHKYIDIRFDLRN